MKKCNNAPFFSVIIPAYNVAPYIAFALESVFSQTFNDFEVIVIDDGSTDDTLSVLNSQSDARLRVFTQPNSGVSVSRNRGIAEARGRYIALLDGDDAWAKDHLEIAYRFFSDNPEYKWYLSLTENVESINEADIGEFKNRKKTYVVTNWFLEASLIPMCSSCVISSDIIENEVFPAGVKMYEDNVAFCRIAMKYPMIGLYEGKTAFYRTRIDSATKCFFKTRAAKGTGVELDALMLHQQLALKKECSKEAKLFFLFFAYGNWWTRIRAAHIMSWIDEMKMREPLSGKWLTAWLIFFARMSDVFYRIMGKTVRCRYNAVERKMIRLLSRQRTTLEWRK